MTPKIYSDTHYIIMFWDHCKDHNKPMKCVISGRVTEVTQLHIVIATWCTYTKKGALDEHNTDVYSILKSTVTNIQEVKLPQWMNTLK